MSQQNHTQERLQAIAAIQKKLTGRHLTYREVLAIMDEIAHNHLGDVLTTFFAASFFKEGFSSEELYHLTKAMVETGNQIHFKEKIIADKHSTGGIAGTRTTMIIVPIIAAAGFHIPKNSSRAITSPAGTADVMETLANVTFTPDKIKTIVAKTGGCIVWGGRLGIAPADDVIINVEQQLSFEAFDKIIVSIMAKKVAMGTTHLVLDIPIGPTAKVKHTKDAQLIAKKFVALGAKFGMNVVCDIDRVHEPSGCGVGPILEARDVLYVLECSPLAPAPLREKSLRLAATLLDQCYRSAGINKVGLEQARNILESGQALAKFREIVKAQGGDSTISSHSLKLARHTKKILAPKAGTITSVNNYNINSIAKLLGAPHDNKAGIILTGRKGDKVKKAEVILTLYSTNLHNIHEAQETLPKFPIYEIRA